MPGALGLLGAELLRTERLRRPKGSSNTPNTPNTPDTRDSIDTFERHPVVTTTPAAASAPTPPTLHQLPYKPHEFGRLEGLGEEGVNAHIKPTLDLVLSAGTDNGDGKAPGPRIGTQSRGGAQPVEPRHDHVQGHHIGPHVMHDVQAFGTIGRGHDLDALQLEVDPDQLPDDLVVVHNKHPTGHAWHNSRVGPRRPRRPGFPHFHPRAGGTTTESRPPPSTSRLLPLPSPPYPPSPSPSPLPSPSSSPPRERTHLPPLRTPPSPT